MKTLLVFDNDGVLRDESVSYQRCITETVAHFDDGRLSTEDELRKTMVQSNDDWERTQNILKSRGKLVDFQTVKDYFQGLYWGVDGKKGFVDDEIWLADNSLLKMLAKKHTLTIVSGAPRDEVQYTLEKNGALQYFNEVLGMHECKDKRVGIARLVTRHSPDKVFFCDDRPTPLKQGASLPIVSPYGIMPPHAKQDWENVLSEAGALRVFSNVNRYCKFLLSQLQ